MQLGTRATKRSAENSIDAVGSRDAAIEFLFVCSLTLIYISRLCEEIISWASQQFRRWIRMDDAYCTGSSIMPQNKTRTSRSWPVEGRPRPGDLVGLMAAVKSLPLAYNRDLAEDKNAVIDAVETLEVALPALSGLVRTFTVNVEEVTRQSTAGFTLATEVAALACPAGNSLQRGPRHFGRAGAVLRVAWPGLRRPHG